MIGGLVGHGASARKHSRYEPLRSLALAISCMAVLLSLAAVAATLATYQGWEHRSWERSVRPVSFYPDEAPAFLWRHTLEYTVDYRPYSVVYLRLLVPDVAPPPGLPRWPRAGEVFASPAMATISRGSGHLAAERYGTLVGIIGDAGLLESHELLVYVGAGDELAAANSEVGTGWGSEFGERIGAEMYQRPLLPLLLLQGLLLVAPAAWFFFASLRIGGSQRARRVDTLRLLGARPRHIGGVLWGECRAPLVTAWCASILVLVATAALGFPLPGLDFHVRGEDVRRASGLVLVALVAGVALTGFAAVSAHGLRGERRRSHRKLRRTSGLAAGGAPLAAASTVIAVNSAIASGSLEAVPVVFGCGMMATLVLLPMSARSWLAFAARNGRRRAWRLGDAGSMTGAAQVAAAPAPAARFGATAAIIIVLVSFVFSYAQAFGGANEYARLVRAQVGNDVAEVMAWPQADEGRWDQALESLSREFAVVEVRDEDWSIVLVGPEPDLERFGVEDDGSSPQWAGFVLGGEYSVEAGEIRPPGDRPVARLLIARWDGRPVDLELAKDLLASSTVPTWSAEIPGDSWMIGTRIGLDDSRWVSWFGGAGVLLALLALWVGYSNELLRASRSLLSVQMLAPDRRFVSAALAWRIVAPVGVAVVGGSGLALVLVWPLTTADYRLPVGFVLFCAVAAVTTGLIALGATVRACTTAARRMSLGVPEE